MSGSTDWFKFQFQIFKNNPEAVHSFNFFIHELPRVRVIGSRVYLFYVVRNYRGQQLIPYWHDIFQAVDGVSLIIRESIPI